MSYCDACGSEDGDQPHACPVGVPALEPPRFCADCGRRMVVQVLPRGWSARCAQHGVRRG